MAGDLNMSALELRPFEEQLANVIYANRLEQAETRGKKEGERNIITKLLKKNTPEEICTIYDILLKKYKKYKTPNLFEIKYKLNHYYFDQI